MTLLLVSGAFAVQPFVQNGEIVATIVVGEEAPSTDVILGSQVGIYLQQFADEVRTGLAVTSDDISSLRSGTFILIGTPDNNPWVEEVLAGAEPEGPYLDLSGNVMVITGRTNADVSTAARLFTEGRTSYGDLVLEEPVQESQPEPEVTQEPEPVEPVVVSQPAETIQPETTVESNTCTPTVYCKQGAVTQRFADCRTEMLEYCPNGCLEGVCKRSGFTSFFSSLFDALTFWN